MKIIVTLTWVGIAFFYQKIIATVTGVGIPFAVQKVKIVALV